MNYIEHLATELNLPVDRVLQAAIAAADKTVLAYLDQGVITPSNLTNEEQAGVIAALRLADPLFPLQALRR